jgi:hypothetical protein
MVDPKMVELGIYNGIPHLLIPVVTDPKKAAGSLQWAVTEMLRRYKMMSEAGVRDLESYNQMVAGEEIEINTNVGEKSIRGKIGNAAYTNYFMYKNIDSSWLQLDVGDNLFRYNAEEGINNLDVFVYFYNRYLEVQECY